MAAAGMVLAGWLEVTILDHARREVFDLPGWAVVLGVVAASAAFVGWSVIIRTRGWTGVAVAVAGSAIVASIGAVPVIGVLLFVVALVWMAGATQRQADRRALAGGLLVALGLPVAALVVTDGPLVECRPDGVSTSSSVFRGSSTSSGSGSSGGAGGESEGGFRAGGRRYTYRCDAGRLVEFEANDDTG